MKNLFIILFFWGFVIKAQAQPYRQIGGTTFSFIDYQKTFPRPSEALQRKEDTLKKQFEALKLTWPAKYIFIRSFKYDSQLEVWVKQEINEKFKLFKTYKVCALAGSLGPKRMQGDYQVPEGFYYINEFNPFSNYYLSLGINYPNASDKILSDSLQPGGDIFIHGSCVTVGCIPITDQQIDELYVLAAHAKDQGQDFIPVHIFPVRFKREKSVKYLDNLIKDDPQLRKFAATLENAYNYFEKNHQLPVIMIGTEGEYIVNGVDPLRERKNIEENGIKRPPRDHRIRNITNPNAAVHQWPQYPGGGEAFMKYLSKLGEDMKDYLPKGIKKAYIQVEFIIDKDGVPVNFKVLKGTGDEDLIDELITELEKMPNWEPATLNDKPVAKKMIQTIIIGDTD